MFYILWLGYVKSVQVDIKWTLVWKDFKTRYLKLIKVAAFHLPERGRGASFIFQFDFSKKSFSFEVTLLSTHDVTPPGQQRVSSVNLLIRESSVITTGCHQSPIPDSDQSIMNPEGGDRVAAEWWGPFHYYYLSIIILPIFIAFITWIILYYPQLTGDVSYLLSVLESAGNESFCRNYAHVILYLGKWRQKQQWCLIG